MLNRVELIGHLGADPELRTFQDGGRVANLSLATTEKWRNRQTGDVSERTEWHRITVRGDGLVGVVERFTRKGSRIYVAGKLQTRKWTDQQGAERYTTEVILAGFDSKLVLLDRAGHAAGQHGAAPAAGAGDAPVAGGRQGGASDIDDDIPF
ncbi:single-stranded DNA-binding protein [Oceanicella actignis]|uniref:Single-stranded DNA-binding protein n=1 Tax=Oceanicella actignis TaxID=1189325 RepID=A0A1M7U1R2_9RHOB|nr:single-stranded DNA-binding protein [Oceanicella actignis]SES76465.1 single-strand binding protein [Oceanicella actignis]SHN76971.1 single-strand DNA-binding protein [Oceanicella actignis]